MVPRLCVASSVDFEARVKIGLFLIYQLTFVPSAQSVITSAIVNYESCRQVGSQCAKNFRSRTKRKLSDFCLLTIDDMHTNVRDGDNLHGGTDFAIWPY